MKSCWVASFHRLPSHLVDVSSTGLVFSSCSGIMGQTTCSLRMGSVHIMSSCVTCHIPHIPNTERTCVCISGKNLGKWVTSYEGVFEEVTHPNLSGFQKNKKKKKGRNCTFLWGRLPTQCWSECKPGAKVTFTADELTNAAVSGCRLLC